MSARPSWLPQRLDDPLLPDLPGGGTVTLALVASGGARADGWSASAAVAMARGWALSGVPTCLCDLALEEPALHQVLQRPNGEGVSDLVLYGASPRHVAQRVDQGFFLVPAGTLVSRPEAVRGSPRWDALVDAFQEAGGLLLLYVPDAVPGLEAVLARADGVVVLRTEDESLALGEAEARFLGAFGPVRSPSGEAGAGAAGAEAGPDHPTPPQDGTPRATRGPATPKKERRGCLRWILLAVLLLVMVLVLAAAMGWIRVPGLGPQAASATLVPGATLVPVDTQEAPAAAAAEAAPLQAWALALEAHRDGEVAAARIRELSDRWPDLLFWVAPVRVRDQRFHRVLAGPATSEDEVEALRRRLGGDPAWIPRQAGLAFRLGEMPDLEAATTWAGVLTDLGIPTHVLRAPGEGGSDTYYIYAGGYASEAEAAELADILRSQDLGTAPLTERRGRFPA